MFAIAAISNFTGANKTVLFRELIGAYEKKLRLEKLSLL
jgi:hypothetical protein